MALLLRVVTRWVFIKVILKYHRAIGKRKISRGDWNQADEESTHPGGFVRRQCIETRGLAITAAAALGVTRPISARPSAVRGSVNRRTAPWFRIHHAERRVGQALALHLVIAFTRSNGA